MGTNAQAPWGSDWFKIGLFAAAVLVLVETTALVAPFTALDGRLLWTSASLLASLSVVVSGVITFSQRAASRIHTASQGPLAAITHAALLGSPVLLIAVPVASTLFQGSYAATLPGATSAHWWLPLAAWTAVSAALLALRSWIYAGNSEPRAQRVRALMGACLGLALVLEFVNRRVKTGEYPTIHGAILVVTLATILAVLHLRGTIFTHPHPSPSQTRTSPNRFVRNNFFRLTGVLLMMLNLALVLRHGLSDPAARHAITHRGLHTGLLVRALRGTLDMDGDGYAQILGGADCDDMDPTRNPQVQELLDNDVDENCDGHIGRSDMPDLGPLSPSTPQNDSLPPPLTSSVDDGRRRTHTSLLTRTQAMNVLLITVDALRFDALESTPENRRDYPAFFELLDGSVRFDRAFSPAAGTDLSLATLLTGRVDAFAATRTTLMEAMQSAGWETFAVLPSEVLRYAGSTLLVRGLNGHRRMVNDRYQRDVGTYSTSKRTTDYGLDFLDQRDPIPPHGTPHFWLWLHYFDVHEHDEIQPHDQEFRGFSISREPGDRGQRYRATVAMVDRSIATLISGLKIRGLWDHTIVVLASDHGESMGEDPRLPDHHGRVLYNGLIHIPLAIRVPGSTPHTSLRVTGLVDLMPTLLELSGEKGDFFLPLDGASLVPDLLAPALTVLEPRTLALNESDQRGVLRWPYKLLWRPKDKLFELYNLESDFSETTDLSTTEPEALQTMMGLLGSLPAVKIDRSIKGRAIRERAAHPPAP